MKILNYLKSKWDVATLIAIWLVLGGMGGVAYSVITAKRQEVEIHCVSKHGILFTDRTGEYICIREKAIVK